MTESTETQAVRCETCGELFLDWLHYLRCASPEVKSSMKKHQQIRKAKP